MSGDFDRIAEALIAARRTGKRVSADAVAACVANDADAYAVQARVVRALGPVGGFKVACKPGQTPIMAPILSCDIQPSPARLSCPAEDRIGIELELGFRVLGPLPAADAPDRDARLAECLALVPVIEIVRTRIAGEASPLAKLADNQINGGLVVGAAIPDWRSLDVGRVVGRLTAGDEVLLDGPAEVPGHGAFGNFKVLEGLVGTHCGGLKPGHVVITGSLNGLPWIGPGKRIDGTITGVGGVALELTEAG